MIALLFPGQGAQRAGMLHQLPDSHVVRTVIDRISSALGTDVLELDAEAALADTTAAQVALYVAGTAAAHAVRECGMGVDVVAGHSVGAFAAAVTAGILTLEEGAHAVRVRAEAMRDLFPCGYGLVALLGASLTVVRRLVDSCSTGEDLFVAMENAEEQVVVTGSDTALARLIETAPTYGVRAVRRLDVAVPSHCPLLAPAARYVEQALAPVPDRPLACRYIGPTTARSALNADAVKQDLAAGIKEMVRWRDTTDLIAELGADAVLQAPPGHAVATLFSGAHPAIPTLPLDGVSIEDVTIRLHIHGIEAGVKKPS